MQRTLAPSSPVKSEASTTSETDRSGSSASDSDSPIHHHRHGSRFDASASVIIADPRPRAQTVVAESRTRAQSSVSASSSSTPSSSMISDRMREAVLQASEYSTSLLLREALRAISVPIRLHHVKRIDSQNDDVRMYQYRKRRAKHKRLKSLPPTTTNQPESATTTTRVLGVTQLHAPITEVIKIIGHTSALSVVLLNPGLADYQTIYTLRHDAHHYTAVKTLSMGDAWNAAHISRRREFAVMEAQQGFQTEDGRKGWVVSYHSLSFSACPEPALDAVRGSIYYTGLVAMESTAGSEQIDLFTVAEYNLKGQATDRVNCLAARERVEDTLALLTGTIEQRAATEMELLVSHDFNEIKRLVQPDVCRLCIDKVGVVPRRVRTHRCRKCCVSVCDDCSTTWRRGKKEMRLCAGCWGETTRLF